MSMPIDLSIDSSYNLNLKFRSRAYVFSEELVNVIHRMFVGQCHVAYSVNHDITLSSYGIALSHRMSYYF